MTDPEWALDDELQDDTGIRSSTHPATTPDPQGYLSLDGSTSDGEDDSELFEILQEPLTSGITHANVSIPADTSSGCNAYSLSCKGREQTGRTESCTALISPASQLATSSFIHLQIHSPIETGTNMT